MTDNDKAGSNIEPLLSNETTPNSVEPKNTEFKTITSPKIHIGIPDTLTQDLDLDISRSSAQSSLMNNPIDSNDSTNNVNSNGKFKYGAKMHEVLTSDNKVNTETNTSDSNSLRNSNNKLNPVVATIKIPEANHNQNREITDESTLIYLDNLRKALRTQSSHLKCPFCQKSVETEVTKKCSIINILCFIITTPILWACLKCCRGKDCNCYDANHKCKRCRREIANYSAC